MSDINDLIHTNAKTAFDQGVKTERNKVLATLNAELTATKQLSMKDNEPQVVIAQMSAIERVIERITDESL